MNILVLHSTSKSSGLKKTSTSAENQLGDIALEITGDVSHRLVLISAVWSSFQQRKTCETGDLSVTGRLVRYINVISGASHTL